LAIPIDAVLLGGPVALAVKRFDPNIWSEVRQEFLASIAEYKCRDGGFQIKGEFVTVRAVC